MASRSRSSSPSRARGRSASPSRTRGRSTSRDRDRGRSASRDRGRSASRERLVGGRSASKERGRSASPSRGRRGASSSPTKARSGRSVSRERRGRSASREKRSRSASPNNGFEDEPERRPRRGRKKSGVGKIGKRASQKIAHSRIVKKLAPPRAHCTWMKLCSYFIPLTVMIVSVVGIIVATGNSEKITPPAIAGSIPSFDPKDGEDPYANTNPADVPRWNNGGSGGLSVTVVSTLEEKWDVFFKLAVSDWEYGIPDAVSITSSSRPRDIECAIEEGIIKVCNGDYGDTNWRGINLAMLDNNNYITGSAARMNEYYLNLSEDPVKQYTMCHELGHALGLPHSDEDFDNVDLGTCMDYTRNFEFSQHPDQSNYEYLVGLYGTSGNRLRGRRAEKSRPKTVPTEVLSLANEKIAAMMQGWHGALRPDGWRILHSSDHGEAREMDLGEGFKLRVSMLFSNELN